MSALLPLVSCWVIGAAFLVLDGRSRTVGRTAASLLATVFVFDAALLAWMLVTDAPAVEIVTGGWEAGVGIRLRVDPLSLFFGAVCALVLSVVMMHEVRSHVGERLLPGLLLLMCAGLHGAFITGDLFNFYVFFELSIITSFVLAAYGYGRAELRGALIYVAVNLIGSVVFLFGVASVYHAVGTLDLVQIAATSESAERELLVPATLLFSGMILKLGLFPMHGWVPALYSHARPPVAAALAGALVNIGAYALLRLGFAVFPSARAGAASVLVTLGVASVFYGSLLAIRRRTPVEIAAYSAVAQAGYIVLGLGVGGVAGAAAMLVAALSGSLEKASMFLSLGAAGRARSVAAFVSAASLAGMPLTFGFVTKVALFRAALEAPSSAVVTTLFTVASVLTLVAAFRFWWQARESEAPTPATSVALVLALALVVVGAVPELGATLVERLASELLASSSLPDGDMTVRP